MFIKTKAIILCANEFMLCIESVESAICYDKVIK